MITALNIANNFLEKGFQEKINISPMKMQKLLYILYKEYLKKTGLRLFTENFEAWQYGPVLPNVYSEFKNYKGNSIKNYSLNADLTYTKAYLAPGTIFYSTFNDIWDKYKKYSGIELSKLTHQASGAWKKSVDNGTYILNDEDIKGEASYE